MKISSRIAARVLAASIGTLLFLLPDFSYAQTARELVDESLKNMSRVQTLTGRIKRLERIDGELVPGDMRFKLMVDPHKIYIYNYVPDEGAEVLWVRGWNKDKAYIHPNKFPWINVSFGLESDVLLRGHHPMTDLGFSYTRKIIQNLVDNRADEFGKYVQYSGTETYLGKKVHVITIEYDNYGFEEYVVNGDKDLFDVDAKLMVPAGKILEINEDVDDFYDIKQGQKLKVPNIYAQKVVFFLDDVYKLPIVQIVYDEKGLFSKYEYREVKVNPRFLSDEFLTDFPGYGF
jgi:hypothetical protein